MYFYDNANEYTGIYFYDGQEYLGGRTFTGALGTIWKHNVAGETNWYVFNGQNTIKSPPTDSGSDLPPEGNWTYYSTHNVVTSQTFITYESY